MSDNNTLPQVSIVIPHYDRAELLAETLRSVEAQEYPNWEVIVVDDGSEPDQWSAIQRYAKRRIRILQRTDGLKGPSRCRNLGAAAAKGDYLIFLDSDDLLAPWCLAQRVEIAEAEPQADLWIFQVLLFRERPGDLNTCWNRLEGDDDLMRFFRSDPPWHTSSPLWRKQAFSALGGFNTKVMYGDDAELHARALLRGLAYQKYPQSVPDAFIRRGAQSRVTSGWSQALIESRQSRLEEGTCLLSGMNTTNELTAAWEGQYFVECEELLFNVGDSRSGIKATLAAWVTHYRPAAWRSWLVRSYFGLGALCLENAYWMIRLARRLLMAALPCDYFPTGGHYENWVLSRQQADRVRERLAAQALDTQDRAVSEPCTVTSVQ